MTPRWLIRFNSQIMDLEVSGKAGRVVETSLSVEHTFTESFGVGLAVSSVEVEYRSKKESKSFGVAYDVKSIGAYLAYYF